MAMRRMLSFTLIAAGLLAALPVATSCGPLVGVALLADEYGYNDGYGYDNPFHTDLGILLYDGLWHNDYVYYDGYWYRHGYGTPYECDWNDRNDYWY
jgi:hypothetical protein